jgi:arylsulfatase A-like enzyme
MAKNDKMSKFPSRSNRRFVKAVIISTVVSVVFVLSTVFSCSDKRENSKPNIIMIVIDTLRADHLSTYGYARNTDPNIADFAKHAVVFQRAVAAAPWTLPSYTSILEGKLAFNHDMNRGVARLPRGTILTSYLKGAGYHTISIQTNLLMTFLKAGDYFDEAYAYDNDVAGVFLDKLAVNKAEQWLSNSDSTANKFFLFVGLLSPHWDYKTDNGFLKEFVSDSLYNALGPLTVDMTTGHSDGFGIWTYNDLSPDLQSIVGIPQNSLGYYDEARLYMAGYDSEIKYADYQVGRILQKLRDTGLYDDSIIIIASDHGENMIDHKNYFNHSDNLYQSLLHVPLLIKFPRQMDQKYVAEHVRTIDVLPTVFDYSAISFSGTDGKSLLPIINGEMVDFEERPVISYRIDDSGQEAVSLIKDNYKLIRTKGTEQARLYNLQDDPRETTDISAQETDRVSQLKDFLKTFFQLW